MQSLYLMLASTRNRPLQPVSTGETQWMHFFRSEFLPRFFAMTVPALMGSLMTGYWLISREAPPLPRSGPTPLATHQPETTPRESAPTVVTLPENSTLIPTLESLEGLFNPAVDHAETAEPEPDTLPIPHATHTGLSSLEVHVNETLLEALDPYLLGREQKQIFARSIPTGHPIPFMGVTSPFGFRIHPTLQSNRFHPGVDLQAAMNTQVMATADGVVEFAGVDTGKLGLNGLGQVISLHHHFGFTTTYSHLNQILVKPGDFVKKGDLIGLTGKSGIVTAPHLHYEIRFIHQYLNPAPFMDWTPDHPDRLFREKNVQWLSLLAMIDTHPPSSSSGPHHPPPPRAAQRTQAATDRARPPLPIVTASHPLRPQTPR
ncbi:MAG: M23 family metallopeptidase [Magnetococcales bacterium]|nr:M23 family metallopeptidase [Magnetococcales bacterium]